MGRKNKRGSFVKEPTVPYSSSVNITIPIEVFETAASKEEIEDWLLANDPEFIKRMRTAKADMLAGKSIPWEQVKKKLNIR